MNPTHRREQRPRRAISLLTVLALAGAGLVVGASTASANDGPFTVDGVLVPDVGADLLPDEFGSVKEIGPKNGTATKIGVIHDAAAPMLAATNPNGNVDLRRAWIDTERDGNGDDWVYFAWERDSNSGSGFIAFEFFQSEAPTSCTFGGTIPAACNPWANRQDGDFLILWDQQGGSRNLYLRTWSEDSDGNLVLSPPGTALTATVSQAQYSADGFKGEAAVNLTDTVFNGQQTCEVFANVIPSTVTGNSDTADYKDTILTDAPTQSNCGSVIMRKETNPSPDPDSTVFDFTTDGLDTGGTDPAAFTLADGGSKDFGSSIFEGDYSVSETDEGADWALSDIDCSASDVDDGTTITPDVAGGTVDFDLKPGDTVDCTFVNDLQTGALRILKKSTKTGNPLVSNSGAVFSYNDDADGAEDADLSITDNGTGDEAGDDVATTQVEEGIGEICVDGLRLGNYTVNETSPPAGYAAPDSSQDDKTYTVVGGTDCDGNKPTNAASVSFTNAPLAEIQLRFRDGGSGETMLDPNTVANFVCTGTGVTGDTTDSTGWDDTLTHEGIVIDPSPRTITCTVVIDP